MGHSHHHHHDHHHADHSHHHEGRNLALAFWLNTSFALIELVGGFLTNSMAILSDALHDLGDSLALGSAWIFQRKSTQDPDKTYTYGYKRFSLMGALINAVVLMVGSVFIVTESVKRLFNPVQPDTNGMVALAVLGVAVNGFALLRLRKGTSLSEKVISLHFVEDVIGWVAVLAGSIVMKFTDAPYIDPILSLGLAAFIIVNVFRNMKGAFRIILQGTPTGISEKKIIDEVMTFEEVESTHDVHLWTLDGRYNILTLHIVLHQAPDFMQLESLKARIKDKLRLVNVQHTTIEFEVRGVTCETTREGYHR